MFAGFFDHDIVVKVISSVVIFCCTTVVSFFVGRWWGRYQARQQWERKQFLGRIIVSLNTFANGWLKIRTVFERSLEEVFLNPVAVAKVRAASLQTTKERAVLLVAKEDRWFLLNFVLNAVSERFSDTLVRYDAGAKLTPVTYLLFLTCEVLGEDRIRKVRAMMMRKDLLESFPYATEMPNLERPWHSDRIHTLRQAAAVYRTEPDSFMPIEIYV